MCCEKWWQHCSQMHRTDSEQLFANYVAWSCGGATTCVVKSGSNTAVAITEQIESNHLHII